MVLSINNSSLNAGIIIAKVGLFIFPQNLNFTIFSIYIIIRNIQEQEKKKLSNKKFIFNADDFGMSNAYNKAVLAGYNSGFLTSASICANGESFDAAVNEVLPECSDLGTGVHLNIIEGTSLVDKSEIPMLVDSYGNFKNGF